MTNSFDLDAATAIVEEIEREEGLIKSSQGKHMKYSRERRDQIKKIKADAKQDGFPQDVIDGLLKTRSNNRKNAEIQSNMSTEYKPIFKSLTEALGLFMDSPLGQAAAVAEQDDMFDQANQTDGQEGQEQQEQQEQAYQQDPAVVAAAAAAVQAQEQSDGANVTDLKSRRPKS